MTSMFCRPAHRGPSFSLLALICAGLFLNAQVHADTPATHDFQIAPQSLASALVQFSKQAGVQVLGATEAIQSLRTAGVIGHFTEQQALEQLLHGTELGFQWTGRRTVTIAPRTAIQPARSSTLNTTDSAPQDGLEEIVVTGSLIRQSSLTATSPVTTISRQDFLEQDSSDIQNVLLRSPGVYAGGNSMTGFLPNAGVSTLNLRNLGQQRTLVLIDGQRLAPMDPYGAGAADITLIPSILIKRVDIITGGASAVYGGDALAGAVNFVIDRLNGFRSDITGGTYEHSNDDNFIRGLQSSAGIDNAPRSYWGGEHVDVNLAEGVTSDDGRSHVQGYFGYHRQDPIPVSAYDYAGCSLVNSGSSAQCQGGFLPATAEFYGVNGTANNYILDPNTGRLRSILPTDVDNQQFGALMTASTRYQAGIMGDSKLSSNVKAYGSFMYLANFSTQIASQAALYGAPYTITCNNGMLTSQELSVFCGGSSAGTFSSNIARTSVESAPLTLSNNTKQYRVTGGLDADISAFHLNVHSQYTRGLASITYSNDLSASRVDSALNGCPAGSPASCVPYNIFQPKAVTPAALAFLSASGTSDTLMTEKMVSATIDGDLGKYGVTVPWAVDGVSIAFGTDYRDEGYSTTPNAEAASGDLSTFGQFPTVTGGYNIKEVYGETRIPVIGDRPFVHDLSVGGAFRVSDYTNFGSTPTYAFNTDYAPTEDVRFRASYNHAIREPSLLELYSAQSLGGGNYQVDGCEGANPIWTQVQCAHTGVTAAEYGHITAAPQGYYHNTLFGGNPDLGPEKGNTRSIGMVITPTGLPDFNLTVDWFNIAINSRITSPPPATVLDLCATTGGSAYCSLVHRDPATGSLWLSRAGYVNETYQNAGTQRNTGVDLNSSYLVPLARFGSLGLHLTGTYVYRQDNAVVIGASVPCVGVYGNTCGQPTPTWRHAFTGNWSTPWKLDVNMTWRYTAAVSDEDPTTPAFSDHIGSASYFDLGAAYHFTPTATLRIGVNNLLDKDPPLLAGGYNLGPGGSFNTYPSTYDPFGRTIFAKISIGL